MSYTYTHIDGQRVETAVARAFASMEAEFRRVWGLDLIISSGTRTRAEQQYLYDGWINRRPGFNLAAKPGQSNHEESGPRGPRALDLRDSGSDSGVTVIGSRRSNWLAANCGRWGFTNAGHYFNPKEGWHYEYQGALDNGGVTPDGRLVVDGDWGAATTRKLQSVLGVPVDGELGPQTISALQRGLGVAVDGKIGPQTVSALQTRVGVTVDGELGPNTVRALQIHLNNGKGFSPENGKLKEDGDWGPATTRKFQKSVGAKEDGELGSETWSKFQTLVGIAVDGEAGPQTYKALQMNVGAAVDGQIGPETVRKLQTFLNAGKGWKKVTVPAPAPSKPATSRKVSAPFEVRAWDAPLSNSIETGKPNTRPTGTVVNRFIVHHTAATSDQENYFKSKNDRNSCPTWYINEKAEIIGFITPDLKPSSTGSANNYSVAVEVENITGAPAWGISDAQQEAVATIAAWLSEQKSFNGVKFDIKLDRQHIIGHNEAGVNATACPGPSMNLDGIVAKAQAIAGKDPEPEPEPEPTPLVGQIKLLYTELGRLIDELE